MILRMVFNIYGLFDPETNELRYIGQTIQKLNNRLSRHIWDAKRDTKQHRTAWIKGLLNKGLKPEIQLLEETDKDNVNFWEQWHISYFRGIGARLTNISDGGASNFRNIQYDWKANRASKKEEYNAYMREYRKTHKEKRKPRDRREYNKKYHERMKLRN